jgi:hypothetical protein
MRISFHIDTISSQALLLLEALEAEGNSNPDQRLPEDWLHDGARCLGDLVANLHTVKEAAIGR